MNGCQCRLSSFHTGLVSDFSVQMYSCVHMYVCMYTVVYICMCVCAHMHLHVHMSMMYVRLCICTYVQVLVYNMCKCVHECIARACVD